MGIQEFELSFCWNGSLSRCLEYCVLKATNLNALRDLEHRREETRRCDRAGKQR